MMPSDPTNLPFPRPVSYRGGTTPEAQAVKGGFLRADHILLEEFAHASVVAYQANEDRNGLLSHYLILAGVVATAVGVSVSAAFSENVIGPLLAVILGLVIVGILSFGFFVRLIQISRKYHDALISMAVIKEFYIAELKDEVPQLQHVLRWRLHSLPALGRSSGTTLFIGSIIALIGSFYLGGAAELLYHYTHGFGGALQRFSISLGSIPITGLVVDVPVFAAALSLYALYYQFVRRHYRMEASIRNEADKFGLVLPGVSTIAQLQVFWND